GSPDSGESPTMVLVKPTEPQSTIYEEADRLHIRIPAKRLWLQLFFLGFWLSAWIVGETLAGLTLAFGPLVPGQPPPSAFLAFWFAGWTAAGAFVGAVFSWKLAGIELVSFNEDTLTLRKEVLGIGRGWTYERGEIRDMRMHRVVFRWFSVGIGGSSVAFN